jgi:hypothetical protein
MIRVEPVKLPADFGDDEGVLVFRDDVLLAVLSRLGEMHEDLAGHWYVEAYFPDQNSGHPPVTFRSLKEARLALGGLV